MSRRRFGSTWWGRAWISALEGRARLDPNRLPRGRSYARQGRAENLTVEAGHVTARVEGRRVRPYRVDVRVRELTTEEWDRVLDVITGKAAHAAALLDGELHPGVDDDAREAGVELLPDLGEIQPRCSCPDWADPCKHSAAVCYLVADALDEDPFLLLELRGRTREQVLSGIRARRRTAAGTPDEPSATRAQAARSTVRARDAFAAWDLARSDLARSDLARSDLARSDTAEPAPLLDRPEPLPAPVEPAPWPVDPAPATGLDGEQLHRLATDATARAWSMLREDSPSMLALKPEHDLARRAAAVLGTPAFDELAGRVGIAPRSLARIAIAWRSGRGPGVDALTEPAWRPSPEPLIAAREALTEAGFDPDALRVTANRITAGNQVQLRYGHDRRWYHFEKNGGAWELSTAPADDPADLV